MNTSMTINATAAWLMALYIATADEQGAPRSQLQGTTQNDIIKEYLARGSYVFPPDASLRLTKDLILFCARETPKWNPMNVCSYHLQEAGATPVQELSYALATAIAVLDRVRGSGEVDEARFAEVVGRISFFVNAGMRFVTELAKMRAFVELWDEVTRDRFGVKDPSKRRFRYGVQVNSLGLTEQQPENNAYRATRAHDLEPPTPTPLALTTVVTPRGALRLERTETAVPLDDAVAARLEGAFARGAGHGLLQLGLAEGPIAAARRSRLLARFGDGFRCRPLPHGGDKPAGAERRGWGGQAMSDFKAAILKVRSCSGRCAGTAATASATAISNR